MKHQTAIRTLFYIAALYDGVIGLLFLVAAPAAFTWFNVTPPNHFGYVQFPGALLIIFALIFLAIARHPESNRRLIPYGILLKLSYCGIVFYYWVSTDLPGMWKPFALADVAFAVLFIWAYQSLGRVRI